MKALLALADGTVYEGESFGASGETVGEVVFNTSMTGYQEILTDPSYRGQLVAMTCPEIGNVGVNREDVESLRPFVQGFIVKEYWEQPSNWRAQQSLRDYLVANAIPAIQGIDTRALVRRLRQYGAQEAVLSTVDLDAARLVERARASAGLIGRDLVKEVTCTAAYDWDEATWSLSHGYGRAEGAGARPFVVAYDYGIKRNILRCLVSGGCRVRVVPAATPAVEVLALKPDGIFLSNGPGDPDVGPYAGIVRELIGRRPIFGICLGHQMLGLALGGRTYKLKFGHHGGNQPVMDLTTRKTEITSQNHGFAVAAESVQGIAAVTHVNLNDQTVEGLSQPEAQLFSVQYHPEASPGPHDANYLFKRFLNMMEAGR
ncbi:MAG: glutamine-hydrolyzing carbamoyl-phosphate synthase small subunit [Deltaproteobacteria bacterium]|nr:glutamine-hydrolyzing carbamoyl-phosphate synthase small subunit [Deltaproteobacteria bacterium]